MPDFLKTPFNGGTPIVPLDVMFRLLLALVFGITIAAVYRATRRSADVNHSFPTTLVLLCVLIAMVTQVIGDNVARAFSLVGALSIVRFRTVVRDTQDTAYVIFAVIVGMAVGAQSLWVAVLGIGVVALAEVVLLLRTGKTSTLQADFLLKVRAAAGSDLDGTVRRVLENHAQSVELISIGTGKQGAHIEASYRIRPRTDGGVPELVRQMNAAEGVLTVQCLRYGFDED